MQTRFFLRIALASVFASIATASQPEALAQARAGGPQSPADSRKLIRLADPNLVIELVAAEPDVISPVAVAWDEAGRMYVAEMTDYPTGPPGGRIRLLEGPRGDGTFERVTIFAADLPFPNSVLPTEGGVLVTAAPDLWLFRDTDGDGVADQKKALLTGFAEGNQQLRVNGLFHGKDGWVYAANGRSSGNLRRPSDPPEKAVSITGHDLRFRLTANAKTFADCAVTAFEPIAGFSQFGLAHDDWGSRFPSWNTVPWRHVVIEDREQERNPYLAPGGGVAEVIPAGDVQLFPASDPPRTFNRESVRSFNASCGPLILRSMGLGEPYLGNAFICEPLLNLVHRRNLRPQGVTFVAERVEQDKEFLASEDPWFHPVFLANGTDGALYVVDFYRRWVEHPAFVPPDQRDKVDWREGYNHGRIWRVRDRSRTVAPFRSVVGNATSDLLARLSYPDGWTRDMAHRLLVARLGSSEVRANQSINLLIDTARRAPSEIGRHHAFWAAFEASRRRDEQLGLDLAVEFLRDPSPRVREQVVSAFGTRLQTDHDSRKALIELAADADPRVRLQAVLALGGSQDSTCLEALLRVLEQDAADPYMRLAVLCGLRDGALSFLNQLASRPAHWFDSDLPARAAVLVQLGEMLGATKSDRELSPVIAIVASQPDKEIRSGRVALLLGLSRGLRRENRSIRAWDRPSPETGVSESPDLRAFLEQLERITASKGDPTRRALGLACLAAARPAVAAGQVGSMLTAEEPELVQDAAARCFGELEDPELAAKVLDRWTSYSIATRSRLLAAMASSRVLAPSLLDAIETKQIHTREFDPATRANLSQFRDSAIRTRVGKLLEVVESDREGIVKRYRVEAEDLRAQGRQIDLKRGATLFADHCATCHRLGGTGTAVGPDLSAIASRTPDVLFDDILHPSREVSPDFRNYVLSTRDGRIFTGLLVADRPTGVTLRGAGGVETQVARAEVEELRLTEKSLMPEGFESTLDPGSIRDLVEFLRQPVASRSP